MPQKALIQTEERTAGAFTRTAIVVGENGASFDIVKADGFLICRINVFDFTHIREEGGANIDLIIDPRHHSGTLLAFAPGVEEHRKQLPGTAVFALDLKDADEKAKKLTNHRFKKQETRL